MPIIRMLPCFAGAFDFGGSAIKTNQKDVLDFGMLKNCESGIPVRPECTG